MGGTPEAVVPVSTVPELIWLGEDAARDVTLVGGKAGSLGELAATHRVPPGFVLTTSAHERAQREGAEGLLDLIGEAYAALADEVGSADPRVAVRSSAVDEDGAEASFAGQHATFLNVSGADAVARAAAACFESAVVDHALEYRERHGLDTESVRMAVLIQQLVPADASAVAFSAHPVSGNLDEVVINASWGLGEAVVSGLVTPDTYVVDKSDLSVTSRWISEKETMTVPIDGGTSEQDVPPHLKEQPALTDTEIVELAKLALDLEQRSGHPVDVESAFHAGQLYVLQSRPITTLGS